MQFMFTVVSGDVSFCPPNYLKRDWPLALQLLDCRSASPDMSLFFCPRTVLLAALKCHSCRVRPPEAIGTG